MNKSELLILVLIFCLILDVIFTFAWSEYFKNKNRLLIAVIKLIVLVIGGASAWILLLELPQISVVWDYFFSVALFYFIIIRIFVMGGVK